MHLIVDSSNCFQLSHVTIPGLVANACPLSLFCMYFLTNILPIITQKKDERLDYSEQKSIHYVTF